MDEKEKNENQEENNNVEKTTEVKKLGFFKKFVYSIAKIEKYPEMATEGVGRAFSYISRIVLIIAIILSAYYIWGIHTEIQDVAEYIDSNFPNFSYSDGTLTTETEEIVTLENDAVGKIIIDTSTESDETIEEYKESIEESGGGILVLKDEFVFCEFLSSGETSYTYEEILSEYDLNEFDKAEVVELLTGSQMNSVYIGYFVTLLVSEFVEYLLYTAIYALIIGAVGYIAARILKMKMKFVAIFNMAMYASTLSMILEILYFVVVIAFDYTIEYFLAMYIGVATIYLLAAILLIRTEFEKKQVEVTKIIEAEEIIKEEEEKSKEEDQKKNEKEERKEKDKKQEKEENRDVSNKDGTEGSNA